MGRNRGRTGGSINQALMPHAAGGENTAERHLQAGNDTTGLPRLLGSVPRVSSAAKVFLDRSIGGALRNVVQDAVAGHPTASGDYRTLLRESEPALSQVALVLLSSGASPSLEQAVIQLRDSDPEIGIFIVGQRGDRSARRFPQLARAGADLDFELDKARDRNALREHVRARLRTALTQAISIMASHAAASSRAIRVGTWCLRNGYRHHTVDEVSTRFGWDRKTLYLDCKRAFGMTVGELLVTGRYLQAVALHDGGPSYQQIADRLNYASASAVAMLLKRGKDRFPSEGDHIPPLVNGFPNQ